MDYSVFLEFNKFNDIKFNSLDHSYIRTSDSKRYTSVTTVISKFHEPFDSLNIAKKCSIKRKIPVETLLDQWKFEGEYSGAKGTEIHSYAENIWNNKIYTFGNYVYESFDKVLESLKKQYDTFHKQAKSILVPVKQEFIVYDIEFEVAGMIDSIFYNVMTKNLQIWDWKSNKKIVRVNNYGEKLLGPLSHLDACNYNEYCLQLSMYKYILTKNTNLDVGDLYICHFNEYNSTYEMIKVKYMQTEVINILNEYRKFK